MHSYPRVGDLAYWINEREAIRVRRAAGMPPPWTPDKFMADVRYCNVSREDDKVTRYIRASDVYSRHDTPVYRVVLARMVNRISTLDRIATEVAGGDLHQVKAILKAIRDKGVPIWGSAYTISTCGKSMDKVDYVIDHVVQAFMEAGEPEYETLQDTFEQFVCVDGFGSFLAAQVIADLKNTTGHPLARAQDWRTFSAHGPGSLKGLAAFYGKPITPSMYPEAIRMAYDLVMPHVFIEGEPLHMQDFQNCLCEFSKYVRVSEGGHARNRYDPHH